MLPTIIAAVEGAVEIPVTEAPQRRGSSAVIYRYYPGKSDGTLVTGRLELRFTAFTLGEAYSNMMAVRQALLGDCTDGTSVIGDGASRIIVCETPVGSGSGYAHGSGLYYVKTSFDLQGRGDIYG